MSESGERGRDLSGLVVSRAGGLVLTSDEREPYRLIGADGQVVESVSVFLRDLLAAGKSAAALRSYGLDLLRWWRFLDAVGIGWDPVPGRGPGLQLLGSAYRPAAAAKVQAPSRAHGESGRRSAR